MELTEETIEIVKTIITQKLIVLMRDDLEKIILFGSCARGDFRRDSDMDVALLVNTPEYEHKADISDVAYDVMEKAGMVANFICIPVRSFAEKSDWYPFYRNIKDEGVVWYDAGR